MARECTRSARAGSTVAAAPREAFAVRCLRDAALHRIPHAGMILEPATRSPMSSSTLPHATERLADWAEAWRCAGTLVLLLDFDGTLAPIVQRPEDAALPPQTAAALERLRGLEMLEMAVVSGRGMADARGRVGIQGIAYAGNHGMEIEGPGLRRIHEEAAAARPTLDQVVKRLQAEIGSIEGVLVEDKELTLSIHYRRVDRDRVDEVRDRVRAAAGEHETLRVTEGKELLEVRPAVDWHKGRAVEFLLDQIDPPQGSPVLYIGDDRTDEDAFRALRARSGIHGEGVAVGDPPPSDTAATAYVRTPGEVAKLLEALAEAAPR